MSAGREVLVGGGGFSIVLVGFDEGFVECVSVCVLISCSVFFPSCLIDSYQSCECRKQSSEVRIIEALMFGKIVKHDSWCSEDRLEFIYRVSHLEFVSESRIQSVQERQQK